VVLLRWAWEGDRVRVGGGRTTSEVWGDQIPMRIRNAVTRRRALRNIEDERGDGKKNADISRLFVVTSDEGRRCSDTYCS
jgi:hypothetical protein